MNELEFGRRFKDLTDHDPLPWQWRLFRDHFLNNALDKLNVIDLPTGLGKTMVMAIWLIAREVNPNLPRRLIYVVDRRTVVDQATSLALKLQDHLQKAVGEAKLSVSPLRGQLADNREWSRDLSRPAIIIGTVDLIGSALLFSGYRSTFKRRPLEAGLLGQDSLLVLDEAHLSKPFEKLVKSIEQFQRGQGLPMRVICMSATSGNSNGDNAFSLNSPLDLRPGEETAIRFSATKRLKIIPDVDKKKLNETLGAHAIKLGQDDSLKGKRIVVFTRSPDDAKEIGELIRGHEIKIEDATGKKAKAVKSKPYADSVAVLTGTMRGLERDELVEKKKKDDLASPQNRVMQRFLDGDIDPADPANRCPAFLISTSAGEVGFDLNADHMVCNAAPLDSMIQRLGRVNRRGKGNAVVYLVLAKDPPDKSDIDNASVAASELFHEGMDLSPKALAEFRSTLSSETLKIVSTPEPTMVELTDILLDAWSMTSIIERMPGRPEVAPWLRGIADELPQTTIAWRAELDLLKDDPAPKKALKAIFGKHRIRAHESLTTNSYRVVEFLKQVVKGRPDLRNARAVIQFSRDIVLRTIGELIDDSGILNADPTLVLPATFGGLDKGMLSNDAIPPKPEPGEPEPPSLDIADKPDYEPQKDARSRLRILIQRTEEGWEPSSLPGGEPIPADLPLASNYDTSTALFKSFVKSGLRVRLVQPITRDEEANPIRSLVLLAPIGDDKNKNKQTLAEHVGAVKTEACRIADELGLQDPFRAALLFSAKWHDEGKKAEIWQRFIGGPDGNGEALGKAAMTRDPKTLRGYRHEFGSLMRLHNPDRHATNCSLPMDAETRDLALHLIATHHGFGRPHFDNPLDRDFKTEQCEAIHADAIRRFARLQRKCGWWRLAWLENLLRCADALASADPDSEDDDADQSSDEGEGVK